MDDFSHDRSPARTNQSPGRGPCADLESSTQFRTAEEGAAFGEIHGALLFGMMANHSNAGIEIADALDAVHAGYGRSIPPVL
jgi:hypothetical protein